VIYLITYLDYNYDVFVLTISWDLQLKRVIGQTLNENCKLKRLQRS